MCVDINMKKVIRKLTKTSTHSYYLIVPKEIVEKYGWKEKQKIIFDDKGKGRIEIRDWRNNKK